jgi:hypothetical protein
LPLGTMRIFLGGYWISGLGSPIAERTIAKRSFSRSKNYSIIGNVSGYLSPLFRLKKKIIILNYVKKNQKVGRGNLWCPIFDFK